jgi:hypothetical protein
LTGLSETIIEVGRGTGDDQTAAIARQYGQPVDLEWVHDGQSLFFLQVRLITQLDITVFSNRIAREMLPGIIKPLVWSVNTRLIIQTWVDILLA